MAKHEHQQAVRAFGLGSIGNPSCPLEERLDRLDRAVESIAAALAKAEQRPRQYAPGWREDMERAIDEVASALFIIHVPRYPVDGPAKRLKDLRRRVSDMYGALLEMHC